MKDHDISILQNDEKQLHKLAAQRQLYSIAKSIFGAQLILSIPVALSLTIIVVVFPDLKKFALVWGVMATVVCEFLLLPQQKKFQKRAAQIQESFDCDVLGFNWNKEKVGKKPDPEVVEKYSDQYKAHKMPPLTDWYPKGASELPLYLGRIVCQRSNCRWDSDQRRIYANFMLIILASSLLISAIFGVCHDFDLLDFLAITIAPLMPFIIFCLRQCRENNEAAERLEMTKEHLEDLWNDALKKAAPKESTITKRARSLQDEIFDNRSRNPLVFDFLFKRIRTKYEKNMNYGASHFLDEAKKLGFNDSSRK